MKVIIAGSRTIEDYCMVAQAIYESGFRVTTVVSGKAAGVDTLGERWAQLHGVKVDEHPADWTRYKKSAGPIRNAEMSKVADALIAVWDGKSKGTKDMIDQMERLKKPVFVKRI